MPTFDSLFETSTLLAALDVLIKLSIAVTLGAVIGLERELHNRPAGIRTHMLIILGVTLISEVSKAFGDPSPSRVAAGIITGIGFLGAGTILRIGPDIKGLTTAASIWATAAIGMAVSVGGAFLWVAIASTLLTLFTLGRVDRLELKLNPEGHPRKIHAQLEAGMSPSQLLQHLENEQEPILGFQLQYGAESAGIVIEVPSRSASALQALSQIEGVKSARWMD